MASEAHALDVTRCTECPLVTPHTPADRTAHCTHPAHVAGSNTEVRPFKAPPRHCPLRRKLLVLRVVDVS